KDNEIMEKLLSKIIIAILEGKDYRPHVLATINKRFIDNAHTLIEKVYTAKKTNKDIDWWITNLIEGGKTKNEVLWFGGLNNKTVTNMMGTAKKEVCIELGKQNVKSLEMLIKEFTNDTLPKILVSILWRNEKVELNEIESLILVNTLSTMKLSVQGGAWSEVGKKTEKELLYSIFELLAVKHIQYILVSDEMKKKGLVGNREIDGVVFTDDNNKVLQIELKLLGIGNPEIADEALARKVDLFLIDRLTPMMIEEAKKLGIKVIELRNKNALLEIYYFLKTHGVTASKPTEIDFAKSIPRILEKYNEELENKKILQKAKELLK
ncbi:MAG: CfrBI family restriction endonuclease, partial [Nitrospirota bacterium]